MSDKKRLKHSHTISQAFVFLLLGVFAVFSTLMVLLGAQLYRGIVAEAEQAASQRVLRSYVTNVVRGNDAADMVRIRQNNGIDTLVFDWQEDEGKYQTMVYFYDGYLRELFTEANQPFEPDYGEEICKAKAFVPVLKDGMLELQLTDQYGTESVVHLALRCSQEGNHE